MQDRFLAFAWPGAIVAAVVGVALWLFRRWTSTRATKLAASGCWVLLASQVVLMAWLSLRERFELARLWQRSYSGWF